MVDGRDANSPAAPALVELKLVGHASTLPAAGSGSQSREGYEIVFADQWRLRIPSGFAPHETAELLRLMEVRSC